MILLRDIAEPLRNGKFLTLQVAENCRSVGGGMIAVFIIK